MIKYILKDGELSVSNVERHIGAYLGYLIRQTSNQHDSSTILFTHTHVCVFKYLGQMSQTEIFCILQTNKLNLNFTFRGGAHHMAVSQMPALSCCFNK